MSSPAREPKQPSQPTVKRLFAVSGNCCAFPNCSTSLIDPESGSVVGEICHISGQNPGAPRYDAGQSAKERHGFDNLILMCNVHHKVVDDNPVAYPVERLVQLKKDHEGKDRQPPQVDAEKVKQFVTVAIKNSTVQGSVVTSHEQTGGQTAHSIHNYYGTPPNDEPVRLEGKLDMAGDLAVLAATGCPGMRFTLICRSTRQAKIQSAQLHIANVDVMGGMQAGFGTDFGYTPMEGSKQVLIVDLIPMTKPHSQEGWVLNRDDVCRFFFPLPNAATTLGLRAKPEDLSIVVTFFDDSEHTVLSGREVQQVLESVFEVYREQAGQFKGTLSFGVRVTSLTPPKVDMIGKTNPNFAQMAKPEPPEAATQ